MTCPHCGKEIVASPVAYNSDLSAAIDRRIEQYGWPRPNSPQKHQKNLSVRHIIKMRIPTLPKGNCPMPLETYHEAIRVLDELLPNKEAT